jgi:hypothetical protein
VVTAAIISHIPSLRQDFVVNKHVASSQLKRYNTAYLCKVLASTKLTAYILDLNWHNGHVMHQQFNIQQLYALPTLYSSVLYLSKNKQRLLPLIATTDWFYNQDEKLCVFFWLIPRRLNFICRRFGTLCLLHLHGRIGMNPID